MSDILLTKQAAAPSTPAAGRISFYPKTDGFLYYLDELGVERQVAAQGVTTATALSRRNKIFNGRFDVWQRGTSLASGAGVRYLADRWYNSSVSSTYTPSQQAFALGQTAVPGEPAYFHRAVVVSVAGAGNAAFTSYKIESVRTFAGQSATLSFWAKADANKNIALELIQAFGTGGAPSGSVSPAGAVVTLALTTAWQKFTTTFAIPSISGKTLGTSGDDYLQILIWYDAGSTFNSLTNSLGQQSGTFDIAQVQFESGPDATPFEVVSFAEELQRCLRYYEKSFSYATAPAQNVATSNNSFCYGAMVAGAVNSMSPCPLIFAVRKRGVPGLTFYNPSAANGFVRNVIRSTDSTTIGQNAAGETGFILTQTGLAAWVVGDMLSVHWAADAEL